MMNVSSWSIRPVKTYLVSNASSCSRVASSSWPLREASGSVFTSATMKFEPMALSCPDKTARSRPPYARSLAVFALSMLLPSAAIATP